jgi:hypothetical protein
MMVEIGAAADEDEDAPSKRAPSKRAPLKRNAKNAQAKTEMAPSPPSFDSSDESDAPSPDSEDSSDSEESASPVKRSARKKRSLKPLSKRYSKGMKKPPTAKKQKATADSKVCAIAYEFIYCFCV